MSEHFDANHIHTAPSGRHFRHGDGREIDGEGNPAPVACPHCGKVNEYADDEGAADGPREYHADCWAEVSAFMNDEQIQAAWDKSPLPH